MSPFAESLHKAHKERLERIASRAFVKAKEIRSEARNDPARSPRDVEFAYEVAYQFMELGAEVARELDGELVEKPDIKNLRLEGGFSIARIQRAVAAHYGITMNDLLSSRRTAPIVKKRSVAMYLAKTLTTRSLPEIGRRFGGRDHTTVLHAVRKIASQNETDTEIADAITAIKQALAQ